MKQAVLAFKAIYGQVGNSLTLILKFVVLFAEILTMQSLNPIFSKT
ncbi:hypothetical protein HAU32_04135 [Weissella confusa]|uniref:Uncharacterized protein n=1 Tax=Weissella fermenti TaxID=2987699 RepID=A0ABT6D5N5_9LACO|nr:MULTISPECIES: hypothetical protein [Weissella]MBJ7688171.1 hypothetical protein [Weissella confusa]MCW0926174.1 hypothetical protein [Weissella sp. LMG 11983]MDF9300274.1 hypothetical protein [Weissella sp. BK2]